MPTNEAADEPAVDPRELLRNLLAISPEDAADVREQTSPTRPRRAKGDDGDLDPEAAKHLHQDGPTADYGDG